MKILRTPDERFENLVDYPFLPNYTLIQTADGSDLRIHHLDEGPKDGPLVLCMHGQPVWSYLYRKMIPHLTAAGCRVIAPDLPGYGKSDKPASLDDYSYESQVKWLGQWLIQNGFSNITFFGQDWGGLIGLRLVVNHEERFDRVVISNTGLPYNPDVPESIVKKIANFRANAPTPSLPQMQKAIGQMPGEQAVKFAYWQKFCWENENMPIGFMMSMMMEKTAKPLQALKFLMHRLGMYSPLPTALAQAYDAPFPDPSYKMGPRAMPSHVPIIPDQSLEEQRKAREFFATWDKPFLSVFAGDDPVTNGIEQDVLEMCPNAKSAPQIGGGHFYQWSRPKELSGLLINFIKEVK